MAESISIVGRRECRKVVLADIQRRSGNHRALIERKRVMINPATLEGRADLIAKDSVFVCLAPRVKARMEIERCFLDVTDANGRRQQPVDGTAEIINRNGIVQTDSCHLCQCMNTGIGSPGTLHLHSAALNDSNYRFEHTLDGRQIRLNLPSMKICPVVSNIKAKAAHKER